MTVGGDENANYPYFIITHCIHVSDYNTTMPINIYYYYLSIKMFKLTF